MTWSLAPCNSTCVLAAQFIFKIQWNRSSSREIQRIHENPKVDYSAINSLPLDPILSQINPVHNLSTYFYMVHFNFILQSTFRSSKRRLSFTFYDCIFYAFTFSHACYMPCKYHPPWIHQPKNVLQLWRHTMHKLRRRVEVSIPETRSIRFEQLWQFLYIPIGNFLFCFFASEFAWKRPVICIRGLAGWTSNLIPVPESYVTAACDPM